jgi:hypothetical protein
MLKRVRAFFACSILGAALAFAGQPGRIAGEGFFTTVQLRDGTLSLLSADVFLDGDTAFFTMDYSSSQDFPVSFFDPPDKRAVRLTVDSAIHAGDGTLAFAVPASILSRARGFTILIGSAASTRFVYFGITSGAEGLARKAASPELRSAAIPAIAAR